MATTILLLAWGAVFASTDRGSIRRVALVSLCVAALLLSVLWFD